MLVRVDSRDLEVAFPEAGDELAVPAAHVKGSQRARTCWRSPKNPPMEVVVVVPPEDAVDPLQDGGDWPQRSDLSYVHDVER